MLVLLVIAGSIYPATQLDLSLDTRAGHGGRQIGFYFRLPGNFGLEEADGWVRDIESRFPAVRDKFDIKHLHIFEIDETFQDRYLDWAEPGKGDRTCQAAD